MKYLFIFIILSYCACTYKTQKEVSQKTNSINLSSYPDTVLENRMIDTLLKLSFVKKSNEYIDSFSNHKQGMAFE